MLDDTALMTRHKEALYQWWKGTSIGFDLQVRGVLCSPEALLNFRDIFSDMSHIPLDGSFRNPARKPVEVGSEYPIIYWIFFTSKRWLASRFLNHQPLVLCHIPSMAMHLSTRRFVFFGDPQMSSDAVASRHITLQARVIRHGLPPSSAQSCCSVLGIRQILLMVQKSRRTTWNGGKTL